MKILAISGSLRAASSNTALVRALAALAPPGIDVTLYDGLGDLPHFSPDLDEDTPPPAVAHLRALLQEADAALICTPEYAHGMPGSLKNALDWTVSSGDFDGKPTAALSASPSFEGGEKAHVWLVQTLKVMGAQIPPDASLTIPFARKKLTATGEVADEETARTFRAVLDALAREVRLHPREGMLP